MSKKRKKAKSSSLEIKKKQMNWLKHFIRDNELENFEMDIMRTDITETIRTRDLIKAFNDYSTNAQRKCFIIEIIENGNEKDLNEMIAIYVLHLYLIERLDGRVRDGLAEQSIENLELLYELDLLLSDRALSYINGYGIRNGFVEVYIEKYEAAISVSLSKLKASPKKVAEDYNSLLDEANSDNIEDFFKRMA